MQQHDEKLLTAIPELLQRLTPEQVPHAVALIVAFSPSHMEARQKGVLGVTAVCCIMLMASVGTALVVPDPRVWPSVLGCFMSGGLLATCLSMLNGQQFTTAPFVELAKSIQTVVGAGRANEVVERPIDLESRRVPRSTEVAAAQSEIESRRSATQNSEAS